MLPYKINWMFKKKNSFSLFKYQFFFFSFLFWGEMWQTKCNLDFYNYQGTYIWAVLKWHQCHINLKYTLMAWWAPSQTDIQRQKTVKFVTMSWTAVDWAHQLLSSSRFFSSRLQENWTLNRLLTSLTHHRHSLLQQAAGSFSSVLLYWTPSTTTKPANTHLMHI